METTPAIPVLPFGMDLTPDEEAETHAVLEKLMTGKPLDSEMYQRIRERADRISQEVFERFGVLDIGVPAIRALRDGEDE